MRKKPTAPQATEAQIQKAVIDLLAVHEAQGRLIYFAVPNGGRRDVVTAANLKRLGVRAGVADIVLLVPGMGDGNPYTIFWELKTAKGSLSAEQKLFRNKVRAMGFTHAIIRSADDALNELRLWGVAPWA